MSNAKWASEFPYQTYCMRLCMFQIPKIHYFIIVQLSFLTSLVFNFLFLVIQVNIGQEPIGTRTYCPA